MYESFFGLTERPFSLLPDPNFLYLSTRHKRVINLLEYSGLTQAGFMVISGDVGAGKTTAIRHFLKHLGDNVTVGVITNPNRLGRLLSWIAMTFELGDFSDDDLKIYNRFVDFLIAQYAKGKRVILIIDEAQNLSTETLEDLRMLSNVNNEKDQLLQVILIGQPELLKNLKDPNLTQFVQRIAIHYHLVPLNPYETASYIRHRLSVVGGSPKLFNNKACAAVYYCTGGVPRLINLLCDQALMYAFAEGRQKVSFRVVMEVATDRESTGLSAFKNATGEVTEENLQIELQSIMKKIRRPLKKDQ